MTAAKGKLKVTRRDGILRRAIGHFWTIAPTLQHNLFPPSGPPTMPWQAQIPNEFGDPIIRSGCFSEGDDDEEETLVVLLHGLAGTVERGYCVEAACAIRRAGFPCLRLALRGSDGLGQDLHHAGFVDDMAPILATPPWDAYKKIAIIGYSLGGHVALSAAAAAVDERIGAVAAICPPLDLKAAQEAIDAPKSWVYRHHLLKGLKKVYPVIAQGGRATIPVDRIEKVSTLREWDALTVVPRFGFDDVDHYYESQSVGPKLAKMKTPSLIVASPADPIVPADAQRGPLARASEKVVARWVRDGGHVFFPPGVHLGLGDEAGVENQVVEWIAHQLR